MIFGGGELLLIGGAIKWGLDLYGNWTTAQTLIFGDPVKKQVDELLAAQQKQEAQLQQINEQLLYAANLDSVHWIKPAANVPQDLAPSAAELATIAAPVQTIVTAFSGGTPQPLLGSALIALPPSFYINPAEFVNYNFIDFFIEDGDWPPLAPEQIWVISKNPHGGAYHIGGLNRSRLTKRGLGLHQQWQPNRRVLPVHLRVKEDAIRLIVGLPPLEPVQAAEPAPKPPEKPQSQILPVQSQPTDQDVQHDHYIIHSNGTVTDTRTKLTWKRCCEGQTWNGKTCVGEAKKMTWNEIMPNGKQKSWDYFAGHQGWRVPTVEELKSLVYCSSGQPKTWNDTGESCKGEYQQPTIDQKIFPNTPIKWFWSASTNDDCSDGAWFVYFSYGSDGNAFRASASHVRLVCAGQ